MKLTKSTLKQIIKEELQKLLSEDRAGNCPGTKVLVHVGHKGGDGLPPVKGISQEMVRAGWPLKDEAGRPWCVYPDQLKYMHQCWALNQSWSRNFKQALKHTKTFTQPCRTPRPQASE